MPGALLYDMLLADNGSSWYISGAPDDHWNNDRLRELRRVHGSDFEAIDESSLTIDSNSGQARQNKVLNAASFAEVPVAPGEIASIFGDTIGPAPPSDSGVAASFDGAPAPLLYASSSQINAIVPFDVTDKTSTQAQVTYNGVTVLSLNLPVSGAFPGLFTSDSSGIGQAAALNQDFGLNSVANPADKGTVVMLFATGAGQIQDFAVSVGGQSAAVTFACTAPGLAGTLQVNARIPDGVAPGAAAGGLTVGGVPKQA